MASAKKKKDASKEGGRGRTLSGVFLAVAAVGGEWGKGREGTGGWGRGEWLQNETRFSDGLMVFTVASSRVWGRGGCFFMCWHRVFFLLLCEARARKRARASEPSVVLWTFPCSRNNMWGWGWDGVGGDFATTKSSRLQVKAFACAFLSLILLVANSSTLNLREGVPALKVPTTSKSRKERNDNKKKHTISPPVLFNPRFFLLRFVCVFLCCDAFSLRFFFAILFLFILLRVCCMYFSLYHSTRKVAVLCVCGVSISSFFAFTSAPALGRASSCTAGWGRQQGASPGRPGRPQGPRTPARSHRTGERGSRAWTGTPGGTAPPRSTAAP
eukprot:Rhum_TRINITY_DN14506_c13_g1::Rhum_TRINITY_DN14506_c13_g1_i1::g.95481::m.95481